MIDSKDVKAPRIPILILSVLLIIMYGLGIYSIYNYLFIESPTLTGTIGLILGVALSAVILNLNFFIVALGVLFGVSVLGVILILKGIAKAGKEVTKLAVYSFPLFIMLPGIAVIVFAGTVDLLFLIVGGVFIGIGGIMLFVFYRWRDRVNLAGEFVEFSAKAVSDELGMLSISFAYGVFALISAIMDGAATYYIWDNYLVQIEVEALQIAGVLAFGFIYLWAIYCVMYFAEGTIVAMVDDWYRNPDVDAAWVGKGIRRVTPHFGSIVKLGFIMSLTETLARAARSAAVSAREAKGPSAILILIGSAILRIVSWIVWGLVYFVTFFALPAIVIEGYDLKNAIKRSYRLVFDNFVDVILYSGFVGSVYGLFMFAMFIFYGASGAVVGYFLFAPMIALPVDPIFVSIASAVVFFVVGFIPAYILMRPLNTSYKTILYEYALDIESGFKMPSRLPNRLKKTFEDVINQPLTEKRWAEPQFPD